MNWQIHFSLIQPSGAHSNEVREFQSPTAQDAWTIWEKDRALYAGKVQCEFIRWVPPFQTQQVDQSQKRINWRLSGQDAVYIRCALTELASEENGNWERLKDIRELLHSLDEASVFRK
jgi:hypothetical protein